MHASHDGSGIRNIGKHWRIRERRLGEMLLVLHEPLERIFAVELRVFNVKTVRRGGELQLGDARRRDRREVFQGGRRVEGNVRSVTRQEELVRYSTLRREDARKP